MSASVVELETNLLESNPFQSRRNFSPESISLLVESIREHGILEPLLVAKTSTGYQIISGEKRWQAAKILGLSKIPVIVKEADSRQILELALVENVQRKELNPLERAKDLKRLKEDLGLSWSDIARKINKSVAYVVNSVKLLELPDALKDGLLSGLITEGHARALGGIGETRLMIEGYKTVLKEKASVRRAEEIARFLKEADRKKEGEIEEYLFSKKEINQLINRVKDHFSPLSPQTEIIHTRVRAKISFELKGRVSRTKEFIEEIVRKTSS